MANKRTGRPPRSMERATRRLDLRLTQTEFTLIAKVAQDRGRGTADAARRMLVAFAVAMDALPLLKTDADEDDLAGCFD